MTFNELLWISLMVFLFIIAVSCIISVVQDLNDEVTNLREIVNIQSVCIDSLNENLEELKAKKIFSKKSKKKEEKKND